MKLPYTVEGRKSYRPSNGTEGMIFMAEFCDRCAKEPAQDDKGNPQGEPCKILSDTFWYEYNDPQYPKEWIREDSQAKCTAFEAMEDEGRA